jgi:hypothetical protein
MTFAILYPACLIARLHMLIHGFVFMKSTKPAHEQDLQVFPSLRKPFFQIT